MNKQMVKKLIEGNKNNKFYIFFCFALFFLIMWLVCWLFGMDFTLVKLVIIYYIDINVVTYLVYLTDKVYSIYNAGMDRSDAKYGVSGKIHEVRFKNNYLVNLGIAGGALAALIACYRLRHKTSDEYLWLRKRLFLALIIHCILWYLFIL